MPNDKNPTKSKKSLKKIIIITVLVAVAGYLAYSVYIVQKAGSKAVVTCTNDGKCFLTAHWHVYIIPKVCGEEKKLTNEKGRLDHSHTHEERNTFHWHDRLPYDKATSTPLDTKPLTLGVAFDELGVTFDKDKFFDKKNGDVCPGEAAPGFVKMLVNGVNNTEFRDYVWKDRDVVSIIFDSKSVEEAEKEFREHPVEFPKLGRG